MQRQTVFLAEDNRQLREIFATWLADTYDVRQFDTGDALLGALDQGVDVVVSDWRLRGTSGTDLLAAIERAGRTPGLVVTSGTRPRTDLTEHGVDEFLRKPVSEGELRAAVRAALSRSAGRELDRSDAGTRHREDALTTGQ